MRGMGFTLVWVLGNISVSGLIILDHCTCRKIVCKDSWIINQGSSGLEDCLIDSDSHIFPKRARRTYLFAYARDLRVFMSDEYMNNLVYHTWCMASEDCKVILWIRGKLFKRFDCFFIYIHLPEPMVLKTFVYYN